MKQQLPKKFLDEMKQLLCDQFEDYIESFKQPVKCGLRVNTMKISKKAFREAAPFSLEAVPWIADGYFYEATDQPSKDPYYAAGLYYLQEPSAMTPADRLPIQKGDLVLDLCAAPGGKATKLACKLDGSGMLFANDISNSRAKALLKNLELFGAVNICVMSETPGKLLKFYPEYFDKILIDAPCSGEGMFRKEPRMMQDWEERGPKYYAEIQREILKNAYGMLKPGGMLLYSTCTFSKAEDEDMIAWFLDEYSDLSLIDIEPFEGFSPGFDGYTSCVRLFPHVIEGEGHFLALLQKGGTISEKEQKPDSGAKMGKTPEEVLKFLADITWNREFDLHLIGEQVYGLPEGFVPQKNIRYLRTGLLLGTLKKGRFEPSQALAMALHREEYPNVVSLHREDYRVIKYLKGDTLDVADFDTDNGWCLVCVDGYSLGWGKIQNGVLKNKYYSGWRWQ